MNDESKIFNILMLPVLFYSFKRSHHTFDIFNFSLNFSPFFLLKKKKSEYAANKN